MPQWTDIKYNIVEKFNPLTSITYYDERENDKILSATDKYFTGKLKEDEEAKQYKEKVEKLNLEERVRYEAQKDSPEFYRHAMELFSKKIHPDVVVDILPNEEDKLTLGTYKKPHE